VRENNSRKKNENLKTANKELMKDLEKIAVQIASVVKESEHAKRKCFTWRD
jgi:hypothetical protein